MMRITHALPFVALAAFGLAALGASVLTQPNAERADCPGKIVCPQTGQLICRDECPTVDADRSDCPGRIVCPQTGGLVCVDRCPLRENTGRAEKTDAAPPSCCAGKRTADSQP